MATNYNESADPLVQFQQELHREMDQSQKTLNEITMLLEQSQIELGKQTQRHAAITGQLQQVQDQLESMSRAEIKAVYTGALDAQQRLLVMRGQLEKLSSDQTHLRSYLEIIKKSLHLIDQGTLNQKPKDSAFASLEIVVKAQEAERQRLSRQMHDGPAQALSNFIVQTEIAARLFDSDPLKAKEELQKLRNSAMTTFQKVRLFISELRPMMLDDLGLYPTVKRYIDTFKEQTGSETTLSLKGHERRFEPYLEVMVFRALQELMGNAVRHNLDVTRKVTIIVQISIENNLLVVSVSDNGGGFDPARLKNCSGIGLKLIQERVELLDGAMKIDSSVGHGCRITIQVPIHENGTPS